MIKTTVSKLGALIAIISATSAFAQSNFQQSVTTHRRDSSQALGRDFWFAIPMNNIDESGKLYRIFISSPIATTAYVESQGNTKAVPVPALGIGTYSVPLDWEMKSSGVEENKAIYVWSETGDLSVYLTSYNPVGDIPSELLRSTESMRCLPSIGLGTDYVVAGYESYFDSSHANIDYPSEFTVTADQDSTIVEITPTTDCRISTQYPNGATTTGYPQGKPCEFTLSRGQCIQMQAVLAQDQYDYDLTGTIIHSNFPVAVVGASMAANIPPNYPHPNYVCDMIPPTRTWGTTYYTMSSLQPANMPDHDLNLYCLVSSVPGQTIYRYDSITGLLTEAVLGSKYDHNYIEEQNANEWYSGQPFMLVQYTNSASFPDGINGSGAPTETVIDPRENFTKTVMFQTAIDIAGIGSSDTNYANIVVNDKDKNVTLDGKSISQYPHYSIDDTFEIYVASNITTGVHIVESDLCCGVNVYGYGEFQSYGCSGSRGVWTNGSSDMTPPAISFTPGNFCIHAAISDFGSGLAEIILDSTNNLSFAVNPGFVPGSGDTSSFADFCAFDSTANGYLQFTAYDLAGNHTVGTIEFTAPHPGFTAQSTLTFDTVLIGTSKTFNAFTVTDTSEMLPITIDSVWTDDSAFTFNKKLPSNSLPVTLTPGESHTFSVTFSPTSAKIYSTNAYALGVGLAPRSAPLTGGIGYTSGVTDGTQTKVRATLEPNPAARSVTLDFSLSQTSNVTFELSSMDGKTVLSWKANAESMGEHLESIDVSPLAAGNYVYRFEANGEAASGKLAIVR